MQSFRKLTIWTLAAVYLLILVGGVVRSTGSGMGCPDWPKCFGSWVPPTSVNELPKDYQTVYAEHRNKKNQRFAKYLYLFGLSETADKLLNDKSVLIEAEFNATKTWIEYVNRIIGVVIGFLIFAVFVVSLKLRKTKPFITSVAFVTFILVGVQGWIGSIVVSTNLTPWTITVHMFLALVIVALLVWLIDLASDLVIDAEDFSVNQTPIGYWWTMACISVLLVQILLGTQVREAIDNVSSAGPREAWIEMIGTSFTKHRSFSWIVFILHIGLIVNLRKTQGLKPFPLTVILLILGTLLSGVSMAWFAIPAWLQPVHLLLATASFGTQFMLLLKLKGNEKQVLELK
jgi:cytochrome c oxidase assembly protein subunit 15